MRKQNIKIKYNCYNNVIKTKQKLNIKACICDHAKTIYQV